MKRLILASQSDTRAKMLREIGYDFEIIPSDYEEDMSMPLPAEELAKTLATGKAEAVAAKQQNAVIVAADTFVVHNDTFLGKPLETHKAKLMLHELSGTTHSLVTGFCVIDTESGQKVSGNSCCQVTLRELTDDEIDAYIRTKEPLVKAGGYDFTQKGKAIVESLSGDIYAAGGLPISKIVPILQKMDIPLPW